MIPDSERQSVELNYTQLLLQHLDRISKLAAVLPTQNTLGAPSNYAEKELSFGWLVKLLGSFIPGELKDQKFGEDIEQVDAEFEKMGKNGNLYSFPVHNAELAATINLLARKGLLYEQKIVGKLKHQKVGEAHTGQQTDTQEAWEA